MTSFFGKIAEGLKDVGKGLETAGKDTAKIAIPAAEVIAPAVIPMGAGQVVSQVLGLADTKIEGGKMNQLEQFAVTMVLGTLQHVVKNPTHAALLKNQLVGLADDIYKSYGMTPAAQPTASAS